MLAEGCDPSAGQGACKQGVVEHAQGTPVDEYEVWTLDCAFSGVHRYSSGSAPHKASYWFRLRTSLNL